MSSISRLSVLVFVLSVILISGNVYAQGNTNARILFVNTIGNNVNGFELPEILLTPAGYENVTTVTTMNDFEAAWQNRSQYHVLIFAYHAFSNDANLEQWLNDEVANLEAWVKSGRIFLGTAGRDSQEQPIVDVFGLTLSDPGTGSEDKAPLEPGTPFAEGIAGNILDASTSSDNTPTNGQVYDEPLPSWVEHVVTRNAAGLVTSVAGHYGDGALWLGAGFEIENIGSGDDENSSNFIGYKQVWENAMNWLTGTVTAVEPASKLTSTWGAIRSSH